jgi:hypothetical protein
MTQISKNLIINRLTKMNIKTLVLVTCMSLIYTTPIFASLFGDEKVEWSQVPAKVQQTIKEHLQGGEIEEIEIETEKKTITVYEATVKKPDGTEIEIKVDEDGNLIEIEND